MKINGIAQGALLGLLLVSIITGALALAQIGSPPDKVCALNFKWIGCAMAAHENLAGGLIGAAGALFAGWLAWTAIREQILMERQDRAAQEQRHRDCALLQAEDRVRVARNLLNDASLAVVFTDEILESFGEADANRPESFVPPLRKLSIQGALHHRQGGTLVSNVNHHVAILQDQAHRLQNTPEDPELHLAIRDRVDELRQLRNGKLHDEQARCTQTLDALTQELAVLRSKS